MNYHPEDDFLENLCVCVCMQLAGDFLFISWEGERGTYDKGVCSVVGRRLTV